MTDYNIYFEYLKGRSLIGLFYRRFLLYPRLCRYLTGTVLDIGCGLGDMLAFRPDTIGVDINPVAVKWCQANKLQAHLMRQDEIPFASHSFDGAILDNVLEHLIEPSAMLSEIRRVLSPSGCLVVGVPGRTGFDSDPDHKVFYEEETLVRVLLQAGFSCKMIFHMPVRSMWLKRRLRQYCIYGIFQPTESELFLK